MSMRGLPSDLPIGSESSQPSRRPRRRRGWAAVAIALVAALLLSVGVSAAAAGTGGADQARRDIGAYLAGMQKLSGQVRAFLPAAANGRAADTSAIGTLAARLPALPDSDVLALQKLLDESGADWRSAPATLQAALQRHTDSVAAAKARTTKTPVSGATCSPGLGTPQGYTDIVIAAPFALAAEVAYTESDILLPDTGDVITAGLVAAWATAEGTRLGLELAYELESECYGARLEDFIYALGGGQTALFAPNVNLEDILTLLGGVDDTANAIRNSLTDVASSTTTIQNNLTTVQNNVTTLQNNLSSVTTTINQIQTNLNSANTKIDNLQTTVNNRFTAIATQIDNKFTALDTRITAVQTQIDNRFTQLSTQSQNQAAADLRFAIEEALAKTSETPLLAFQLPNAQGGYLDNVRAIVRDGIDQVKTRYSVTTAETYFARADQAKASGDYKLAFRNYQLAYQSAAAPLSPTATR